MYTWSYGGDSFLKLGKTWIKSSMIESVGPRSDGSMGSEIVLVSGRSHRTSTPADEVIDLLVDEEEKS